MFGRSRKQAPIPAKIDTLVARSATVHGDVEFTGGLHLEGRIIGNVRSAEAPAPPSEPCALWISEAGVVEGTVEVPNVVINGAVIGDVVAAERVVIGAQARISGNVQYGAIEMALGAKVNGKLMPMAAPDASPQGGGTDAAASTEHAAAQARSGSSASLDVGARTGAGEPTSFDARERRA